MARPTSLTAQAHERIIQAVTLGVPWHMAAQAAGVTYDALRRWRRRGEEALEAAQGDPTKAPKKDQPFVSLVVDLEKAQAQGVENLMLRIQQASMTQWQAAAWLLERRHPEHFSRKDRVEVAGSEGQPVKVKLSFASTEEDTP